MKYTGAFFSAFVFLVIAATVVPGQSDAQSPSEKSPKAIVLVKEALSLEESGQVTAAITKYKEVLKLESKDFVAMNSVAGLYGVEQKPAEQVLWAQKALDVNPKYWKALINLGNGHAVQGKFELAITAFKKAHELVPKEPIPVYSLGVVAENRNQLKEALAYYLNSVEIDTKFENGLFSAAAMHATLKQFKEAKALLLRLLEINPGDAEARGMLQAVEREMAKP